MEMWFYNSFTVFWMNLFNTICFVGRADRSEKKNQGLHVWNANSDVFSLEVGT